MHDESFSPLAMPLDYHGGSKMNLNFLQTMSLVDNKDCVIGWIMVM
jgi:hypothetical protein